MPRTDAAFAPPASSRLSAASRISSSVNARRGPGRRRLTGAVIASSFRARHHLDLNLYSVHNLDDVQGQYAVQRWGAGWHTRARVIVSGAPPEPCSWSVLS